MTHALTLETVDLTKRFGAFTALDGVSLKVRPGTVHALLGENGAGKSTLMSILFGHYSADAGHIEVFGQPLPPGSPRAARAAGIGMVHQHFTLADNLSVLDNVSYGLQVSGVSPAETLRRARALQPAWSERARRELIAEAGAMAPRLGTPEVLRRIVEILAGVPVLLLEDFRLRHPGVVGGTALTRRCGPPCRPRSLSNPKRGSVGCCCSTKYQPRSATASSSVMSKPKKLTSGGSAPQTRFVDFVFQPITDATGAVTGIFVDGIDVTERIVAQEAIRTSEAQFRGFAQAMPNHVWTAPVNGLLDWFNERVAEYSGREPQELLGARWLEIVHPDDREMAIAQWQEALASGEAYQTEFRIRNAAGQDRWHLVRAVPIRAESGEIIRWIGTNTDIHEQKLAEVETARDRDRLWTLSQELMLVCDYAGVITAVNPSAERLLGWSECDMVGQSLATFIHPDDLARTIAELGRLSQGATTLAFENRYRSRTGDYRLLDWTAVPDAGRIHAIGRDITEERRATRDRDRIWNQ